MLARIAYTKPVIVSSVGYDFRKADYGGFSILGECPHVVVAIRDFYSLCSGLSHGLRGSPAIEWRSMPSLNGHKDFGFLLFKPSKQAFPIIINPCVLSKYRRIVSAIDQISWANGVHLIESSGQPYEWLGAMTDAVEMAVALFESGPNDNPVWIAARVRDFRLARQN